MAQTSTPKTACDAFIQLDDALGVPQTISGSTSTASIDVTNNIGTVRTFGEGWDIALGCGSSATISITAVYSTAAAEAREILAEWEFGNASALPPTVGTSGVPRTVSISIPNNLPGSEIFTAEVVLENHKTTIDSSEPAPMTIEVSLKTSGPLTRAIIA